MGSSLGETVELHCTAAAKRLSLSDAVAAALRAPDAEVRVNVAVRDEDGEPRIFPGYRVQHSAARGPYKGGVRFGPGVDLEETRALAQLMTWKTALAGLPLGGAKGAVDCPVKELSRDELEAVARGFIRALGPLVGPDRDVMAPDAGTGPQVMAWMADEYGRRNGASPGVVTGKPVDQGGLEGRDRATGSGLVHALRAAAADLDLECEGARVVVQGFGEVGRSAAVELVEAGARVVGITKSDGGVHAADGIDPRRLREHLEHGGAIRDFPDAEAARPDTVLERGCEVVVAAAMPGLIGQEEAEGLRCKVVVEGANAPLTRAADEVLERRGITIVPDLLANTGGVIASQLEWQRNRGEFDGGADEVDRRVADTIGRAYEHVVRHARDRGLTLRAAAYEIALERVLDA